MRVIRSPAAYNWSTKGNASRSKRARRSSVRSFWATLDSPLDRPAEDTGSAPVTLSKTAGVLTLTDLTAGGVSTAGHSGEPRRSRTRSASRPSRSTLPTPAPTGKPLPLTSVQLDNACGRAAHSLA
ncbi:hypothetical protein Aph02nite_55850 [Actinoplanes philippinensis]|nr:hypothetical protein Aph02nite_55850 [Actinoplanes philippinensis]